MSDQRIITIPIIGASIAGLSIAHSLLSTNFKGIKIKILLINPTPTFYWAIAAPRIITKPTAFSESQYLIPIVDGFKKYSSDVFEFVLGKATSINFENKTIQLEEYTNDSKVSREVKYDYLVISSGSTPSASLGRIPGVTGDKNEKGEIYPFKLSPTSTTTISEAIQSAQETILSAKRIVVIGAGPIGVEIAGELGDLIPPSSTSTSNNGEKEGEKEITLISATPRILPVLKESASSAATSLLTQKGVKVLTDTKVVSVSSPSGDNNRGYTLHLSNGDTLDTDIYIPTTGVIPNNSFIPKEVLDEHGWVKVDPELKVSGVEGVYAAGDITNHTQKLSFKAEEMAGVVVGNLVNDINNIDGTGSRWWKGCGSGRKTYNEGTDVMMVVPVGSSGGTGQAFGWVLISFMVWLAKGRDYFIWKARSYVHK
ncbi:hypothetical protein AbraIFM66950_009700 [Aspergillus brasiliensis]|nr:hypothetical protein AbraIFM66950_009700 [Aspergillus brasiliensis]